MRRFYFTERESVKSKFDKTIRIYALKNRSLSYVTEIDHRPGGGSRGSVSEAFLALVACGAIPKKYLGDGYFYGNGTDVCEHYDILEIY